MKDVSDTPRPVPHNVELEQGLLGALLINNDVLSLFRDLEPHHFYDPVHARIFDLARKRIDLGLLASPVTMRDMLAADAGLADLGGPEYLARMAGTAIGVAAAKDYAKAIVDLYSRRVLISTVDEMVEAAAFGPGAEMMDVAGILDIAESTFMRLRSEVSTVPLIGTFGAALDRATDRVNAAYQRTGDVEVSTGLPKVDKLTGGLLRGCMTILGARTSMGKTALSLELIASVLAQGKAAHMVSLEMTPEQLAVRMVSRALAVTGKRIEYARIQQGRLSEDEFRAVLETGRDNERLPLTIADSTCSDIGRIRASIVAAMKRAKADGFELGLAIVDYLQMVRVAGAKSKTEEVTEAARALQRLAKELDLPIVVVAQVSRAVEDRKNKRPQLNDIKWAGEAEEAADQVLFLYRHAYYLDQDIKGLDDGAEKSRLIAERDAIRNAAEVIVAKNRHGITGTASVFCDLAVNRFMAAPPMTADAPQRQLDEFA